MVEGTDSFTDPSPLKFMILDTELFLFCRGSWWRGWSGQKACCLFFLFINLFLHRLQFIARFFCFALEFLFDSLRGPFPILLLFPELPHALP